MAVRLLLVVGLLTAGLVGGCEPASDSQGPSKTIKTAQDDEVSVGCRKYRCGPTRCQKCGLFKGSPGCCVFPKVETNAKKLCSKCGVVKGSVDCCKKAAGKSKCHKSGTAKADCKKGNQKCHKSGSI